MLHAQRDLLPSKATSLFSDCGWNEYSNGTAIWLVNRQQPASFATQGLSLTRYSGGTSTPLLGDSLSGPHSHPAGWAWLFPAVAAAGASSSPSARVRGGHVSLLRAGGRVF